MSLALNILPDLNSQLTITGKGPYLSFLNTELLAANIDTPDINLKFTVTGTVFLRSYLILLLPGACTSITISFKALPDPKLLLITA